MSRWSCSPAHRRLRTGTRYERTTCRAHSRGDVVPAAALAGTASALKGALRWVEVWLALWLCVHWLRRGREAERVLWALLSAATLSALERDIGPPYAFPEAMKKLGPGEVNRPLPWSELTEEQRRFQATKMAIHAAMVDRMDRNIGRVLQALKELGLEQNTVVMFLSDNGGCTEEPGGRDDTQQPGIVSTYTAVGPAWGWAQNTPFRRYKSWVHEGGISTPLIVRWPGQVKAGALTGPLQMAPVRPRHG